jgi:hypothetical protein
MFLITSGFSADDIRRLEKEDRELWSLLLKLRSAEYRLRRIASDPSVPEWVRDYASGEARTLCASTSLSPLQASSSAS